jgi:GNAT superfamily N-acetyltransferase
MEPVRRAVEADVTELVRLRAAFAEYLKGGAVFETTPASTTWRTSCAAVLRDQLAGSTMCILVIDADTGLAACGYGTVTQMVPGPHLPDGQLGYVSNVFTEPAYRRRGYSRAIMNGLLSWFRERSVRRVDLHASADAEPLYRDLGFTDHPDPALSWRS